jgi:glycosyltransferase involved in cell wall biosynthesis
MGAAVDFRSSGKREAIPLGGVQAPELSVVIPCLNEVRTLGSCLEEVQKTFREHHIAGEVVVADNGSTDGSRDVATRMGARVVQVEDKGYGSALRGGTAAARGKYIIIGDADGSHDFTQIPLFLQKLQEGFDVVIGNRFKGGIKPGAMRPLHRYVGNPFLTWTARLFFQSPCGDQHCGFRGFTKDAFLRMGLRAGGMEFASEMVIKASRFGMRIAEVPTTQSRAGRTGPSHLRTWRDGWRHLRLLLLYCPRWLFLYPGGLLMFLGLATGIWLMPHPRTIGSLTFDVHTLLYAATAVLVGFQGVTFAAFTKVHAIREGLLPRDPRLESFLRRVSLEVGLAIGTLLVIAGLAGSVYAVGFWGFDRPLDPTKSMRIVIPAVCFLALGGQVLLSSFFLSVLSLGSGQSLLPPGGTQKP